MLEVLLKALAQWVGDLVEADELPNDLLGPSLHEMFPWYL